MASPDAMTEVLRPILLRSTTPGANEKVLKYLESMKDNADEPRSMLGDDPFTPETPRHDRKGLEGSLPASPKVLSPSPKKSRLMQQFGDFVDTNGNAKPKTNAGPDEMDDGISNIQDGQRSDLGELPVREPGPGDPPGPRYESFDSGPSFGNMGPLPSDPYMWQGWRSPHQQPQANGVNGTGAKLPSSRFPDSSLSPKATSTKVVLDRPASPTKGANPMSPKAASKAAASKSGDADRPLSPFSSKSKVSGKTFGTVYPPLPASVTGDTMVDNIASPKSRALSKAPSISPSDSPSQMKPSKSSGRSGPVKTSQGAPERDDGADLSRHTTSRQAPLSPTGRSRGLASPVQGLNGHQNRPFSPYRHAPTNEDLLHAVIRGRAAAPSEPHGHDKESSVQANGKRPSKLPSVASTAKPTTQSRAQPKSDGDATPTPSRPHSPIELNQEEERIVHETLSKTPRTSYYAGSTLEPGMFNSRYHDMDLCILLHQENDPTVHDVVKRALRKAIHQRMKKLGMNHDRESIKQFRKSFHDHDPSVHLNPNPPTSAAEEAPGWAKEILDGMARMQQRIDGLGPKIDDLRGSRSFAPESARYDQAHTFHSSEVDQYGRTPMTQTVNIHTQPSGTIADSMFQQPETEIVVDPDDHGADQDGEFEDEIEEETHDHAYSDHHRLRTGAGSRTHGIVNEFDARDGSPGQQYLEEELYKLRQKRHGSQSALSHRTWELAREDGQDDYEDEDDEDNVNHPGASGLPTIPDSNGGGYNDRRQPSPPLPPLPEEESRQDMIPTQQQMWHPGDYSAESQPLPPWQRIHQRLLSWAIIWPMVELDNALNSTTRGHQVDEVALSIWSTQTYKRYVRSRMTDSPPGVVDRLFVPPNMADAISNAVFNGRHGDACGMLRDLWSPFGLEGMPRLLVVLAKHRTDADHWVVHRFSLPDGALTTYDSFPERTLPDGRPLGWWFAIRVAWPNAIYPSPDRLMQKMVRLHRPMQLPIDNSVAAAGIWRNILMGSRAERSLDLERLRDLINTEVRNLRLRKHTGKLSINAPRPAWEDLN